MCKRPTLLNKMQTADSSRISILGILKLSSTLLFKICHDFTHIAKHVVLQPLVVGPVLKIKTERNPGFLKFREILLKVLCECT